MAEFKSKNKQNNKFLFLKTEQQFRELINNHFLLNTRFVINLIVILRTQLLRDHIYRMPDTFKSN